VPNFADPTFTFSGSGVREKEGGNGVDMRSPMFQAAQKACQTAIYGWRILNHEGRFNYGGRQSDSRTPSPATSSLCGSRRAWPSIISDHRNHARPRDSKLTWDLRSRR